MESEFVSSRTCVLRACGAYIHLYVACKIALAAFSDSNIAGPLSGFIVDHNGVEVLLPLCLIMTIPWLMLMSLGWHLVFFIACLALECMNEHTLLSTIS